MSEVEFLRDQLTRLLALVERTGTRLCDNAALIAEHGGSLSDCRDLIALHGRTGAAMVRAADRTYERLSKESHAE